MHLGEPVYRAVEQPGRRVAPAVPAWIVLRVMQPEVSAEVDHDRRRGAQPLDRAAGFAVAHGREDHAGIAQGVARREAQVGPSTQGRVDRSDGLARKPLGGDLDHLDLGMAGQEAQYLTARIPGAADDQRPDHGPSSAASRTETARSSSVTEMCSPGVWSSCESPGPYATA